VTSANRSTDDDGTAAGDVPPAEARDDARAAEHEIGDLRRYASLKLFEYLSMGRPIVGSDLPSIRG
jgi:hypothetical protein